MLFDDFGGKAEGIHLMIGRRPYAAFGNSTGDQQMLEYAVAGDGARLMMLVLHDDAQREYAYGPAQGLPQQVGAGNAAHCQCSASSRRLSGTEEPGCILPSGYDPIDGCHPDTRGR